MLSSLLLFVVTTTAFQLSPPQAANGFHPSTADSPPTPQPPKPVSNELRGDIMMAKKMYREAIDTYKQSPETAVIANKIGIAYHQLTELDRAKKYYERAIKLERTYAEAINNLGTVFYAQKSYRRAIGEYRKALRVNPNAASILSNLGMAYFARKNYDLASATFQKAFELDPTVFEHRGTTGVLLEERSVEERAKFHYYLAKTYAKAGKNDLALLYIRKALEEGFKEREKFLKEAEFEPLRDDDEFKKIMAQEPKPL
ncbi:MAG: tetratricopeptide repeat protein [Bryobacteraceae bacterium]|jgi:tetratricopeptide (TPR) repeat protein